MDMIINNASIIIFIIGVLAFVVSVITQVTKEISFLAKIPTSLQVVVLSIALTTASCIAYAQYTYMQLHWYMIAASIVAGFFVAFVAMFGWEKISEIHSKFINR
ncbi:MAG: ribonuclease [Acutalibacteraceae bacterium]